jgi:hypothetical protein
LAAKFLGDLPMVPTLRAVLGDVVSFVTSHSHLAYYCGDQPLAGGAFHQIGEINV